MIVTASRHTERQGFFFRKARPAREALELLSKQLVNSKAGA